MLNRVLRIVIPIQHHDMRLDRRAGTLEGHCRQGNIRDLVEVIELTRAAVKLAAGDQAFLALVFQYIQFAVLAIQQRIEALVGGWPVREQRDNTAAVNQVVHGAFQMIDCHFATRTIRRVHYNRIEAGAFGQILKLQGLGFTVRKQLDFVSQFRGRFNKDVTGVMREEARDCTMTGRRFQGAIIGANVCPFHHFVTDWFRRGEVVKAFTLIAALGVLLAAVVVGLGFFIRIVIDDATIRFLAALALLCGRSRVRGVQIALTECSLKIPRGVTHCQVFSSTGALGNLGCKGVFLEADVQNRIFDHRIRLQVHAIDAAFSLNRVNGRNRQTEIDQGARHLAGNVMQAQTFAAGLTLNDQYIDTGIIIIEQLFRVHFFGVGYAAVNDAHTILEYVLQGFHNGIHTGQRQFSILRVGFVEQFDFRTELRHHCGLLPVVPGGRQFQIAQVKRMTAHAFLEAVEYDNLAA